MDTYLQQKFNMSFNYSYMPDLSVGKNESSLGNYM